MFLEPNQHKQVTFPDEILAEGESFEAFLDRQDRILSLIILMDRDIHYYGLEENPQEHDPMAPEWRVQSIEEYKMIKLNAQFLNIFLPFKPIILLLAQELFHKYGY
jgi:hypothetical protein